MDSDVVHPADTGIVYYIRAWKGGQVWNGSALENWTPGNVANYTITLTDKLGGQHVRESLPALSPIGNWELIIYIRAGGSPATTDKVAGVEYIYWDGAEKASRKTDRAASTMVLGEVVADVGNSETQFKTNLTETTNNHYNGRVVIFTTGALIRQAVSITGYDGTDKILTVTQMTETPSDGDAFIIV